MQFPYNPKELVPIDSYVDDNGDMNAVYRLPAPKNFILRAPGIDVKLVVNKVRICLTTLGPQKQPTAVLVPFDENDKEIKLATRTFPGVVSVEGVLEQLGFTPLSVN